MPEVVCNLKSEPEPEPQPKKKRKKNGQSVRADKEAATRYHSLVVRARGVCELAEEFGTPCDGRFECAHIVPRRWSATRTFEANALCLCATHHRLFDMFPEEKKAIIETVFGVGTWWPLRARAREQIAGLGVTPKMFWRSERARLKAIWEAMQ